MNNDLEIALDSITRSYRTLLQNANGAIASIAADKITRSKSGTQKPRNFHSEADELLQRVQRVARIAEMHLMGALSGRLTTEGDNHHPTKQETRKTILAEAPGNPAELAFVHGITEDHVRTIWREAGLDPKTGDRLDPVPLTESPGDTVRRRHRERSGS